MPSLDSVAKQHVQLTRRFFLQIGAAGTTGLFVANTSAAAANDEALLAKATAKLEYLTRIDDFRIVGRGKPVPSTLTPEKRLEVGLDPKTWKLEVISDPDSNAEIENPMTREQGNALDWKGLMKLADRHAVRFMKVMTCTNIGQPLGMGLWEGVPLRHVVWMAGPVTNVRRLFYYGYHNDDPKQRFQSSLSIGRVLEDPPGEHPVILCYKLNGKWLTPKSGAPVRMVVPEAYGNKSVKWLQRIVLSNRFTANDTYATWNNDTESHLKTYARFLLFPSRVKAGASIPITGVAQVGMSGLKKVQFWIHPVSDSRAKGDRYFNDADWRDARILPPPNRWGSDLPDGQLPAIPSQFDAATGQPLQWPIRDTLVHWAIVAPGLKPGEYVVRCRTIDANGIAQPMPRPLPKGGANQIQAVKLTVTDS